MNNSKFKIAVLSLSALVFFSCKKDDKPAVSGDVMTFTGTIGGAKTEIYDGVKMKWSEYDEVRINGVDCTSELTSDRTTATFSGTVVPADDYEAYYPASLYKDGKYVLPDTQHYAGENGEDLSNVNPMYARSTTTDLLFHNICAVMKLSVNGTGTLKKIVVSAKQNGQPALLSGEFDVEGNASDGYYAKVASTGSTTLTLDFDEDKDIELNDTVARHFYIAMPQGEYSDLVFEFIGSFSWKSPAVTRRLEAGTVQNRELVGVSVSKPKKLSGKFSVGVGKQVQFSRGNLQCVRKKGSWSNGYKWRFADNQYDIVETTAGVSAEYANQDTVTLFGWGTSGRDNGNVFFQPYNTTNLSSALSEGFGYGPTKDNNYQFDLTGDFAKADWGYSYCEQEKVPTDTWRVFSREEWVYLIEERTNFNNLYGKGSISGMKGLILLPDDWELPAGLSFIPGEPDGWPNSYTYEEWSVMESAGAVFLPTPGYRSGAVVINVGLCGYYWSSSKTDGYPSSASGIIFYPNEEKTVKPTQDFNRYTGFSVRLVSVVK